MIAKNIRIAIVDDHALFKAGLVSLLSHMPGITVVGEGSDGQEAIEIANHLQPDVLLLDITMPVMNGIDTVKAIKTQSNIRILMLTISREQDDLFGAIQAGADGYILKNAEQEELYKAIVHIHEGRSVLSPEVTAEAIRVVRQGSSTVRNRLRISDIEMDVLKLLSRGRTNHQIAAMLNISKNTTKTHIRNLLEKLAVSNRVEAVSKAIRLGII
jgi:DNA-binding NarL/FixJ family response regulator